MPIDYQNELGVTLLHVAAQNGNKRIAKLCLRKGADVNKRNNNGQVGSRENRTMYCTWTYCRWGLQLRFWC